MKTQPTIIQYQSRTLVGIRSDMSFTENRTRELWSSFRPRAQEIGNRLNDGFYSVQYYEDFERLTPLTLFSKWACVEVSSVDPLPPGMEVLTLDAGLWACFIYKGTVARFPAFWTYIFQEWLPNSDYTLADRHHYEYLDHRWLGPLDENSVEEVYIPLSAPYR